MIGIWNHKDFKYAKIAWNLQQNAYKREAELIGRKDIPPLLETVGEVLASELIHLAETEGGVLNGMLVFSFANKSVDIHKLMVAPQAERKGCASRLLAFAEELWNPEEVIVSTAAGNIPATHFYQKNGFELLKKEKQEDDLVLVFFHKTFSKSRE